MPALRRIAVELERTLYVVAGLPIALRAHSGDDSCATIRRAFARRYWRPATALEWVELVVGLLLAPVVVPMVAIIFTVRNGPTTAKREGTSAARQLAEQLRLYFSDGILGPWYYIFSLHRDGAERAPTFLQRCETKWGVFLLLRAKDGSPLSDKKRFADRCAEHGVRCIPYLLCLDRNSASFELPDRDLFVKPINGRGGKGAERWDRIGFLTWTRGGEHQLSVDALTDHLRKLASDRPMLVQQRYGPHRAIAGLTSGALPTVRALTCLDEHGDPEVVAAVFRMSIGRNRTVDNIHAGGLACGVSLDEGRLGAASDLGSSARLGWHSRHPTTGAQIEGTRLPCWDEVKALATEAHRAFADRVIVGWDIAILKDGPTLVEGNGSPDMDLMQRFMDLGFCRQRFGELLAHQLRARGFAD